MADLGCITHESPDGEDFSDRYAAAGYECRVPGSDGGYKNGGENVAKTHFMEPLVGGAYHRDAADLAVGLVDGWMDSPGHRENILDPDWRCEGIGIAIAEEHNGIAVYATQNFC